MSDTPETQTGWHAVYLKAADRAMKMERQRDAYAETLRGILADLNVAYAAQTREAIREKHPELAQEASQP